MKFLKSLQERNLKIEDLPKSQQKKISELTKLNEKVSLIEADLKEDTDDESIESLEEIKKELIEADDDLVSFIQNFDLEKSIQQRERLAKMRKKKLTGNSTFTESKQQPQEPKPLQGSAVGDYSGNSGIQVGSVGSTDNKEVKPEFSEEEFWRQEAKKQAKLVNMYEKQLQPPPVSEEHVAVEEEFEKRRDVKKQNMPVSLIIIGIGAFFLTWGAVNYFKNKR